MESKKPLILIAEDDAHLRGILRVKLESLGFRVQEAHDGKDAIDKLRNELPELVVMDVSMPVMSGTEALSIIKGDPALKHIRVMFLSNLGEKEEINAWLDQKFAKELGAIDYVRKTEDLSKIVEKISEMIHG